MVGPRSLATVAASGLLFTQAIATADRSSGCRLSSSPPHLVAGHSVARNIMTPDGRTRTYTLHAPMDYDPHDAKAYGIIISFHGKGESIAHHEAVSGFTDHTINPDMFAVYPEGVHGTWHGEGASSSDADDIGFVNMLLDRLESELCIDRNRIHAAGKSDGGGFAANVLACHSSASKRFASFASVAGAYYTGDSSANCHPDNCSISCSPGRLNVPVLDFHGDADETIPYLGGARKYRCVPSIPHFMQAWALRDGYDGANYTTHEHGGDVVKYEYGNAGHIRNILTHYRLIGIGHVWPSINGNSEGGPAYVDASELIIHFFKKYPLDLAHSSNLSASKLKRSSTLLPTTMYQSGVPYRSTDSAASQQSTHQVMNFTSTATATTTAHAPPIAPGSGGYRTQPIEKFHGDDLPVPELNKAANDASTSNEGNRTETNVPSDGAGGSSDAANSTATHELGHGSGSEDGSDEGIEGPGGFRPSFRVGPGLGEGQAPNNLLAGALDRFVAEAVRNGLADGSFGDAGGGSGYSESSDDYEDSGEGTGNAENEGDGSDDLDDSGATYGDGYAYPTTGAYFGTGFYPAATGTAASSGVPADYYDGQTEHYGPYVPPARPTGTAY